jgi:hypothetical protein
MMALASPRSAPKTPGTQPAKAIARKRIIKPAGYFFSGGCAMKRSFAKPATTSAEQVSLLSQRGTIIDDDRAEYYLQHLN